MYKYEKNVNNIIKDFFKEDCMAELTQLELYNLKTLIELQEKNYHKLNTYASQAVDPQIKQTFTKSAQEALNTKQKLMSFLND